MGWGWFWVEDGLTAQTVDEGIYIHHLMQLDRLGIMQWALDGCVCVCVCVCVSFRETTLDEHVCMCAIQILVGYS